MNSNWDLSIIGTYREPIENTVIKPRLFNEPIVARPYVGPNDSAIILPAQSHGNQERAVIYQKVSDITKALLEMLYGGKELYIKAEKEHPLEKYILSFEENFGDDAGLMALGERVGLNIVIQNYFYPGLSEIGIEQPEEYTTTEQFIDKMSDVIHAIVDDPPVQGNVESSYYAIVPTTNLPINVKDMIDINRPAFYDLMSNAGIPNIDNLYDILYGDRLYLLVDLRKRLGQKLI